MIVIAVSSVDELEQCVELAGVHFSLGNEQIVLAYGGSEGLDEAAAVLDVTFADVHHLGPDLQSLYPMFFWAVALVWARYSSEEDLAIVSNHKGTPFVYGRVVAGAVPEFVVAGVRIQGRSRGGRRPPMAQEVSSCVQTIRALAEDHGANKGLRAFSDYMTHLEQCLVAAYWSPNETEWSDLIAPDGEWVHMSLGLGHHLDVVRRTQRRYSWLPEPSKAAPSVPMLHSATQVPSRDSLEQRRDRLRLWSAWFLARARMEQDALRNTNSLVLAWRSYEQFVLSVALASNVVQLDLATGTFKWRSARPGGSVYPTTQALLNELAKLASDPRPADVVLRGQLDELRLIRARSLWGHGVAGVSDQAAKDAGDVVRRSLEAFGSVGVDIARKSDALLAYLCVDELGRGILAGQGLRVFE